MIPAEKASSTADGFSSCHQVLLAAASIPGPPHPCSRLRHGDPQPALTLLPLAWKSSKGPKWLQNSNRFPFSGHTKPLAGPSSVLQLSLTRPVLPLCQAKRAVFLPCAWLLPEAGSPSLLPGDRNYNFFQDSSATTSTKPYLSTPHKFIPDIH